MILSSDNLLLKISDFPPIAGHERYHFTYSIPFERPRSEERKTIHAKVAEDFTSRVIPESGLRGVTRSMSPIYIKLQLDYLKTHHRGQKSTTSRFDELEPQVYATDHQLPDSKPNAPTNSVLIRPKCGETLSNELAVHRRPFNKFSYCQGRSQECEASGSHCDLTRSTEACTSCRPSGKPCHLSLTHKHYKYPPRQCSKCLWRFSYRKVR